jgi:hypothetical protein
MISNIQSKRLPGERSDPPVARPRAGSRGNKKSRLEYASGDHTHTIDFTAAKMSKTGTQALTNLTETLIQFGQADYDTDGIADLANEQFLIVTPKIYTIKYEIRWENGTAATYRKAFLYVNSNIVHTSLNVEPNTNYKGASVNSGAVDVQLAAGDIVTLQGYHNNGSNLNVTNLNGGTWLSILSYVQ